MYFTHWIFELIDSLAALVIRCLRYVAMFSDRRFSLRAVSIIGGDLALFPGGRGTNQACAAAMLGDAASFIAQVGRDPFGAALVASLRAAGVDTKHVGFADRPTGCASIYVLPGGENSIVVSAGANAALDPATAVSRLAALESAGFVLSQLEIPLETVEAVFTTARSRGAITILDPAPACRLPNSTLRWVDFLTPNQSESAALLGNPSRTIRDFADAEEAACGLLALGPSAVVVKLGPLGCLAATAGLRQQIDGQRVVAVDTTAAGDALNSAFAVALAEGSSVSEVVRFANTATAVSVTRHGAQASLPCRDEVRQFLEIGAVAAV
jgi:ribokinase